MSSTFDTDPNFTRAMWLLENSLNDVDDLICFWKLYGPVRLGPWPERLEPWWQGL